MLFMIKWTLNTSNRVECWNVFGNMTPLDDIKDSGEGIKLLGRWHELSGAGGVCIAECDDASKLNSWMLNWSPLCEISIQPVVDDAVARANLKTKPFFNDTSIEKVKSS